MSDTDATPRKRRSRKASAAPDDEGALQHGRADPARQDPMSRDPAVEDDMDDPRPQSDPERNRPQTHTSRESEIPSSYPAHGVPDDEEFDIPWQEPTKLDAPTPRAGYVQRWVHVMNPDGSLDSANASKRWREGWRPREPSTVPGGFHAPTLDHGKFAGLIGVEGSILCEMPISRNRQRERYYRAKQARMDEAIERDLHKVTENTGIPIDQTRKTRVTTGRRPQPAPDTE